MKTFMILLFFLLYPFLSPALAQDNATSTEITGSVLYFDPDQDNFGSGVGADVQFRFWLKKNFGLAFALGYQKWKLDENASWKEPPPYNESVRFHGDAQIFPVGGSFLFRPALNNQLCLTFEGGVRYVIVDDDIDRTLQIDNGAIVLLATTLEAKIIEKVCFLGGIGYQFDILKGDVQVYGRTVEENELNAFFLHTGIAVKF